jgi:hypothetical protein
MASRRAVNPDLRSIDEIPVFRASPSVGLAISLAIGVALNRGKEAGPTLVVAVAHH